MVQTRDATAALVPIWTGHEVRVLREARRMSTREFGAHLGVSDRIVAKWEARGREIRPRPVNQAALDTSLARSTTHERVRFANALGCGVPGAAPGSLLPMTARVVSAVVRHPEDDTLMSLVEAGMSQLGPNNEPAFLPGFLMDIFPVTNAAYARFVAATGHRPPAFWDDDETPPDGLDEHPVVGVNYADATAYAHWAGKQLPTGVQWERAARGVDGRRYPWGEQPSAELANVAESKVRATTRVGWHDAGVSPHGVYDLCGNAAEWCATSTEDGGHEVRGGSFTQPATASDPTRWASRPAGTRRQDLGFRCVLSLAALLDLLEVRP